MTIKEKLILWWTCFHFKWIYSWWRDVYLGWLSYKTARTNTRVGVAKMQAAVYRCKLNQITKNGN